MEHERKLVVQISKVSGRSIHVVARLYLLRLALITGSVTLAGWTAGSPGAEPALTEAWVVIFQERVQSATLSHDGRLLAVTREPAPRISLVEVASGKVTASFEEWPFSAARWHPWKPLLAIGGGDAKSERYFLLDAQTGRSQEVMKTGVDVFCWAEDGEHLIIGQALYLDIRNRKALSRHPPWRPQKLVERLYRLMDGPKGYLAAEILREYRLPAWPSAPRRLERDLKPPRPEDWPRPKPPEQQPEPKPAPERRPPGWPSRLEFRRRSSISKSSNYVPSWRPLRRISGSASPNVTASPPVLVIVTNTVPSASTHPGVSVTAGTGLSQSTSTVKVLGKPG